jgi:hypothetical protein
MTKITIELGPGDFPSAGVLPGVSGAHMSVPAPHEAVDVRAAPAADLLAQAAVIGAINAGPGPASVSAARDSAPIASSIPGVRTSSNDVSAAGSAPKHVFVSRHSAR